MIAPPEVVFIAITRADGSLAIYQFVTNDYRGIDRAPTTANIEADLHQLLGDEKISWRIIQPNEIPEDRTYRDAWHDDGQVQVHMEKAREIHREHLRRERVGALAALDIEYQRADEDGSKTKKADVARRKQELRDITKHPSIEEAKTPDQLKQAAVHLLGG